MTEAAQTSPPPVFVAGCGRSGTTYLKTLLDASPELFIPPESLFIADYLRWGHRLPMGLRRLLLFREPQLRSWSTERSVPLADFADAIRVLHERAAAAEGRRVWGQKTPRFVRHIPLFRAAFPGCRFILLYRDPRAVVSSMLRSPRHTYCVARACRRWLHDNGPVLHFLRHPDPDVLVVRYEEFVHDFDGWLERLFRFVGVTPLPRTEVVTRGRVREQRGTTFSSARNNLRDGLEPRPETLDSWKKHLSAGQVHEIERRCGPLMQALGYAPLSAGETAALPARRAEGLRALASALADIRVVWAYLVHWPYYPLHHLLRRGCLRLFAVLPGGTKPPAYAGAPAGEASPCP